MKVWFESVFKKKNVLNMVTVKKQEIHKLNYYELREGWFKWGAYGVGGGGRGSVNINVDNFKILW